MALLASKLTPKVRKTLDNVAWLFLDRVLRIGVGAVVGVWVARYLGPEQFGLFNYALAFVAMFGALSIVGLNVMVVRNLVLAPERQGEILGTALVIKSIGAIAAVGATIAAFVLSRPADPLTLALVTIGALGSLFQVLDVVDYWFQSQIRAKYAVYARNGAFFVASVAKVGCILTGAPLIAFAWVGLAEMALTALGLVWAYRALGEKMGAWRPSLPCASELLKGGVPLMLAGLAVNVQLRIDQIVLGQVVGHDALGQYSAALRLVEFLVFVPVILQSSLAPVAANRRAKNEALFLELMLNLYRLMAVLFVVVAVPVFFFAEAITQAFYGSAYAQAGGLLAILTVRIFFTNFGVARILYTTNEGLFRYDLVNSIIAAAVCVGASWLLIPQYQAMGAIYASMLSFVLGTFVLDAFYPPMRRNLKLMLWAIVTPWKLRL